MGVPSSLKLFHLITFYLQMITFVSTEPLTTEPILDNIRLQTLTKGDKVKIMGMIRVSDQVENRLKEVADGRSMNATIEKILAYCSSPDGFCPAPQADTNYEPYLLEQMNKRFDKIESMLDDTLVDRIEAHKTGGREEKVYIEWDVVRELFYEFLDERSTEWRPGIYNAVSELNDELNCYIQDGFLCVDDHYGKQHLLVQVSPRVQQFLDTHTAC